MDHWCGGATACPSRSETASVRLERFRRKEDEVRKETRKGS